MISVLNISFSILLLSLVLLGALTSQFLSTMITYGKSLSLLTQDIINNSSNISSNNKVVILNFYDNPSTQFKNAKPILDKYNFKASFFVVCNWIDSSLSKRMTWKEIKLLKNDGQYIESHTMNHHRLNKISTGALNYEVGQSKKCLTTHGINASVFAPPHGKDWKNATIIDTIAKYYDTAMGGFSKLMFLDCDGYKKMRSQTNCRAHLDNGTLSPVSRYSIREWSHNSMDNALSFNDPQILKKFVTEVNSQITFNKGGIIRAIPIIAYHSIDNNKTRDSTGVNLFAQEMKYLHDNRFIVLTMHDLAYDKNSNNLYIKSPLIIGNP